jgi:hypothetical protein
MSAVANKGIARGVDAAAKEKRQKTMLAVLAGVLVLLLVWQLPKILGGDSGSTSATESVAAAEVAAPATAATAGTPAVAAVASAVTNVKTEKFIKHLPARDPFVPLAGEGAGAAAGATQSAAADAAAIAKSKAAAAAKGTAKAGGTSKVVATSAVIFTNGKRQVLKLKQSFKVGDAKFKLLSIGRKSASVAVVLGNFKGGKGEATLRRDKPVTFENTVTGVKYVLRFTLPLSAVPPS